MKRIGEDERQNLQHSTMAKYLNEFRNSILTAQDRNDVENFDNFCTGTKPEGCLKFCKMWSFYVYDYAIIELNSEIAFFEAGMYSGRLRCIPAHSLWIFVRTSENNMKVK